MNSLAAGSTETGSSRKRRWGIGLTVLIALYIAAVVAFIIAY